MSKLDNSRDLYPPDFNNSLSKLELFLLRRLFAREVRQGWAHDKQIRQLFRLVTEAAMDEFTEDNKPTLDAFLREQFEAALTEARYLHG